MIRLFMAALILAIHAAPVHADPGSLVAGITAAVLINAGVSQAFVVAAAWAAYIATTVGLVYGGQLLAGGGQKIDPGNARETFTAAEASEIRALGRVRLGGAIDFGATRSADKYRLVLHARALDGFEQFFLGGFEVIINDAGEVRSRPYIISGTVYIVIKTDLGDPDKTAWADLIDDFPALWTSAHRARGIAQTLVRYISPGLTSSRFLRLYQSGPPAYETVARGERIFDPRDEGQDADDPSTWLWSDNGINCALHMMRSFPRFGLADFDLEQIAGEADRADAIVTTLTGTERRARCWGVWPSEGARNDILRQLLRSIGAEIITLPDGKIGIQLVDDARTATLTIPSRHTVRLTWRSGPESVERPNRCRLKYYSPERKYELAEIDLTGIEWASAPDEIDAVGEQIMDIELPFCPSASQAQRIARREFAMARGDQGVLTTNMVGMAAWGQRVIDIVVDDLDETLTCAIAAPRCRDTDGLVEIPFVVVPTLDTWTAAEHEAPAPAAVPDVTYSETADTPSTPSEGVVVTYPGGAKETRFRGSWGAGDFGVNNIEGVYREADPLPGEWRQLAPYRGSNGFGTASMIYLGADLAGVPVDVRARGYNSDDEVTAWSGTLAVTPSVDNTAPTAPGAAYDFDVTVTIAIPNQLRIAYLRVTPPIGPPVNTNVRPCQTISVNVGGNPGTWTFTCHASDGTASAPATVVIGA